MKSFYLVAALLELFSCAASADQKIGAFIIVDNPPAPINALSSSYLEENLKLYYDHAEAHTIKDIETPESKAAEEYERALQDKYGITALNVERAQLEKQYAKERIENGVSSKSTEEKQVMISKKIQEAYAKYSKEEDGRILELNGKVGISKERKFIDDLKRELEAHDAVDIFVAAHTNDYDRYLHFIPEKLRKKIRLVYNSGCYNSHDSRKWLVHGVGAYVGHPGSSSSPLFMRSFIKKWGSGLPLKDAVASSNLEIESFLSEPATACETILPSALLDRGTFADMIDDQGEAFLGACILRLQDKFSMLINFLPADMRCVLDSPRFKKAFTSKADDKVIAKVVTNLLENTRARISGQSEVRLKATHWSAIPVGKPTEYDLKEANWPRTAKRINEDALKSYKIQLAQSLAAHQDEKIDESYVRSMQNQIKDLEFKLKNADAYLAIFEENPSIPVERKLEKEDVRTELGF